MIALLERWTPSDADLVTRRRARIHVSAALISACMATAITVLYVVDRAWWLVGFNVLGIVGAGLSLPVLRRYGPDAAAHGVSLAAFCCLVPSLAISGGIQTRYVVWLLVLPMLAGLLGTARTAFIWGGVGLLTVLAFLGLDAVGIDLPRWTPRQRDPFHAAVQYTALFTVTTALCAVHVWHTGWAESRMRDEASERANEAAGRARAEREGELREVHEAELTELNVALRVARDEALAASKAKSRFLANMSHELRTPLNAILGYSAMLVDDLGTRDPELASFSARIEDSGRQLLTLVDRILDLTAIESGEMALVTEVVDVTELVEKAARAVEPPAQRRGNTVSTHVDPGVEHLHTDPIKLEQALHHLLDNACRFTEAGSITLSVAPDAGGAHLVFTVADTGIGMSADAVDTIFARFQQADGSMTRQASGAGLGLPLARGFARLLGGDIEVESTLGEGSTFALVVPIDRRSSDGDSVP